MTDLCEKTIRECIAALPAKSFLNLTGINSGINICHQALEALLPEPVDPLLIEAREIAAKYWEDKGWRDEAKDVRAGYNDDTPSVKVAYAALKSREAK